MKRWISAIWAALTWAIGAGSAIGETLRVDVEGGMLWATRNDARIPGNTGTRFDLADLTGAGPDPYARLHVTWEFAPRHVARLTLAPIDVDGSGRPEQDTLFEGATFTAGEPTQATFKFNTYRATYRWLARRNERWEWGLGAALLVRDAKIELRQGDLRRTNDNIGLVPLLHLYGAVRLNGGFEVTLDAEGAGSTQGRALDAAVHLARSWPSGWRAAVGYRTLEGGADNDSVYTFAWLHFASISVGYRF